MGYDMITTHGLIVLPYWLLEGSEFLVSAPYRLLEGSEFLIITPYRLLERSKFFCDRSTMGFS